MCCYRQFTALFKNNETAETQHSQDLEAETEVPKSPIEEEQECPICLEGHIYIYICAQTHISISILIPFN